MERMVFRKGEVVFREGDLGKCFYQIEDGTAGVYIHYGEADQRKLTDMQPGQYFGEMAVIDAWPRSTTILAESDLHVIEIPESGLLEYFTEQPDKIYALMKQLGNRIRSLTDEYNEVREFIREKEEQKDEKKPGFLAKLKKYMEISALANKNAGASMEEVLITQDINGEAGGEGDVRSFRKGDIIFRTGDEGVYMYAVHSGTVGIYSNYGTAQENKLTTLYPNSFFGEMGMIAREPRSATAVVEEDGTDLELFRAEELEKLFRVNPIKIDMILRHLSQRLRSLTKEYVDACRQAVEGN